MLIDIDDALLARHQELLMKLIDDNTLDKFDQAVHFETENVVQKIINITTTAYFKRGDNEI